MTENERKIMFNLANMIQGEVNRICVSDDVNEIERMKKYAVNNINMLSTFRVSLFNNEFNEG